eukprot:6661731-Prymnesium_polylepis.1
MVVAAGKWARYYPSYHSAQVALASLPTSAPPPTLVLSNLASPHLLHVHPVRPLLDIDVSSPPGCYPQSTCADFHGLLGLERSIAVDVQLYRSRLKQPTLVLMAPNWVCDARLYPQYKRKLQLPLEKRVAPCARWIRERPERVQLVIDASPKLTIEQVCGTFTFSSSGTDALSRRMEEAARSHGVGWLPATALTRDRCNMTSDARHYPGLVPAQLSAFLALL